MIVDLERNDLSRVCEPGSVRWPELMEPHALAGVEHLVSRVEGVLREDVGLTELLGAVFPGGSVTGAPKIAAVDLIAGLEPVGRGASMGALRHGLAERRPRTCADDPHLRGRRRAHPPLGRRRHRLGLRSRRGDRGVVDEGGAAALGDRGSGRGRRSCDDAAGRGGVGQGRRRSGRARGLRRRRGLPPRARGVRDPARLRRPALPARGSHRAAAGLGGRLGLPPLDASEIAALGAQALGAAGVDDAFLRFYATPGREGSGQPVVLALVGALPADLEELRARGIGLHAVGLGLDVSGSWPLSGVKSMSYAVNMMAVDEANDARGGRRALPRAGPDRARVPDLEHLVAPRVGALHAVARPRDPRRRHARACSWKASRRSATSCARASSRSRSWPGRTRRSRPRRCAR